MAGREGETFPGFFMAEAGQPDTGVREVPRRRKKAMTWNAVIESSPPSMGWKS